MNIAHRLVRCASRPQILRYPILQRTQAFRDLAIQHARSIISHLDFKHSWARSWGAPICSQFGLGQGVRRAGIKRPALYGEPALYGDTMRGKVPLQLMLASRQNGIDRFSIGLMARKRRSPTRRARRYQWIAFRSNLHVHIRAGRQIPE